MARKLIDSMSSEVHINHALRHARRCKQTKGAVELANAIEPFITELETKNLETKKERLLKDNAYDDWVFNEGGLDDCIKTISDAAKQYDRENPGRPIHKLLFPEGGYTKILRLSSVKKNDKATEIIERIKSLGEEHPLIKQIGKFEEVMLKVASAKANLRQAETNVRSAVAHEEVAQVNLRKQYEFNYLDAIKMFGKTFANRLFPQAVSKKKAKEMVETLEV